MEESDYNQTMGRGETMKQTRNATLEWDENVMILKIDGVDGYVDMEDSGDDLRLSLEDKTREATE